MKTKCITIDDEQEEFLLNQKQSFNFSKFTRSKLYDYMKLMKDYKNFTEEIK